METTEYNYKRLLVQHLEKKGIDRDLIPRFIKDLTLFFDDNPSSRLFQVSDHLHFLGWNEIELDYHSFQLAKVFYETKKHQN